MYGHGSLDCPKKWKPFKNLKYLVLHLHTIRRRQISGIAAVCPALQHLRLELQELLTDRIALWSDCFKNLKSLSVYCKDVVGPICNGFTNLPQQAMYYFADFLQDAKQLERLGWICHRNSIQYHKEWLRALISIGHSSLSQLRYWRLDDPNYQFSDEEMAWFSELGSVIRFPNLRSLIVEFM